MIGRFATVRGLVLATVTGLVAHALVLWGVRLPLAGTPFYADPREVFMLLGSALSGPVGAVILSLFLGSVSAVPEFVAYRVLAYLVAGVGISVAYRSLLRRRIPTPSMLAGWLVFVLAYYGITITLAVALPYFVDRSVFDIIFGDGQSLGQGLLYLTDAIRYEAVFTAVTITIFWLSLPVRYRTPLWGEPFPAEPRRMSGRLAERVRVLFKGRALAIRLAGWIILLSIIPFFGVVVTLQNDAQSALDEITMIQRRIQAQTLAGMISGARPQEIQDLLVRFIMSSRSICGVVDSTDRYVAHADSSKIGGLLSDDYSPSRIAQMKAQGSGAIRETNRGLLVGFSWTIDGSRLVIAEFSPRLSLPTSEQLSAGVQERLALGLGFIAVSIATVIWFFVATPLRTLTGGVQSMRRDHLTVTVPIDKMDDEVRLLGESFNTMTGDLRTAYRELEDEIAERIEASEALRMSRAQLAEALRIARMGSFDVDLRRMTIALTEEAFNLIGPVKTMKPVTPIPIPTFIDEVIDPEDRQRFELTLQTVRNSTSVVPPRDEEFRIRRADGSRAWLSVYWSVSWEGGHPTGVMGTMQDITAKKRAELESESAKQRFRAVVENNIDAIVLVNANGDIAYGSPSIEAILGHSPAQWEGTSIFRDVHEDDLPMVRIAFDGIRDHAGASTRKNYRMRHADGSWVWIESIVKNSLNDGTVNAIVINLRDITERKQAEDELVRLRQAVEISKEVVFMTDSDGVFRYVNRAFTSLYGYSPHEVIGTMTPRILKSGMMPQTAYEEFWKVLRHEFGVQGELTNRRKDGSLVLVEATANAVRDSHGNILGYLAIQRDITERKRAEEALRHSEESLRVAQRIGKIGSWEVDVESQATTWSAETYRVLGLDPATFVPEPMTFLSIVHPEDRDQVAKDLMATAQQGLSLRRQHRIVLPGGTVKFVEILGEVERQRDGVVTRVVGSIQDITEAKLFEEALNDKLRRLQLLRELGFLFASSLEQPEIIRKVTTFIPQYLGVTRAVIRFVDPSGRSLVAPASEAFDGPAPSQPIGFSISGRCVETNRPILVNDCRTTDLIPQEWVERFGLRSVLAVPIRTSAGVIGVLRVDDSEQYRRFTEADVEFVSLVADQLAVALENARLYDAAKQAEAETERLNAGLEQRVHDRTAQLEAVNQELESFSYSVSHDLRAPLRHISGFVELLRERIQDLVDEESLRYLTTVSQSAVKLGNLIDELLAFSRIGRTDLRTGRVDLARLASEVRRDLEAETEGRVIDWSIGDLPPVQGDPTLLKLVLSNLLSNAVKFSRDRSPARIEVGSRPAQHPTGLMTFFVRDNGAGFDQSYAGKLFGVFQRLHTSEEFEGTGIGLANVRRIIQRHGGATWAEGEIDAGATFFFTLPSAEAA
ncbi:MAG: PAS domain S-box protein [Bacteroidetes bacterium]|nr:PAS domain S-box protein [Bacteroidota bacterium]